MINIQGLQKTTLLDYPEHVAATVFLGGCNMRCPFCHNMNIVTAADPLFSEEYIMEFLSKRLGILDGVCITGGEPTLYTGLPDFIRQIKELGYLVKLDTNGTNPDVLKTLTDDKLVDYVAMDIKSSPEYYGRACGIEHIDFSLIKESIGILMNGKCDYEFRTTAVAEFLNETAVRDIGKMIKGAGHYYLQGYVESEYVPDKSVHAVPVETLREYQQILSGYVNHVALRGID